MGQRIEELYALAVLPDGSTQHLGHPWFEERGIYAWHVLFFYPSDYTWVCPTELLDINAKYDQFLDLGAMVWGISTDSAHVHRNWIKDSLGGSLRYPLVSDRSGILSQTFDCFVPEEGYADRCTVILDPNFDVRHYSLIDGHVGRNIDEILRLIAALQTSDASHGQCVTCAGWKPGDPVITLPGA
jgi:peroxiredoxin (alkyl hydroperoxide reductase subunit C)